MISNLYVKEAINNVKKRLKEDGMEYNKKLYDVNYSPKNPFSSVEYMPELETSTECNVYQVPFYHNLIGVPIYIINLRRIGIAFEV